MNLILVLFCVLLCDFWQRKVKLSAIITNREAIEMAIDETYIPFGEKTTVLDWFGNILGESLINEETPSSSGPRMPVGQADGISVSP